MNDRLRESVSALVDGEADELELRRLLASDEGEEVREAWRSFHVQRDSLAGVDMRFAQLDISARVQAALADEQQLPAAVNGRWWRPVASVAVAASVAAVVAIGMRGYDPSQPQGAAVELAQAPTPATAPAPVLGRVYPAQTSPALGNVAVSARLGEVPAAQPVVLNADELARQRLQQYMLRHTERAALNNGQGLISFARVSELHAE